MKGVERAATALRREGTTAAIEADLYTCTEYERTVELARWQDIARRYGDDEGP
jgi:hypothetical protein